MFDPLFHSILLAQLFGLYMIIMSIIMLSRTKFYRGLFLSLKTQSAGIFIGGSFGLMFGLFLVMIHHTWALEHRLLVTIVCWFILIKSILWLALPERMLAWTQRLVAGKGYYVWVAVMALLGIILLTRGFHYAVYVVQ